jgi:transcriptional regulator with XRE-family HTH domain
MEFGIRLKELRKQRGITQRELADMIKSNNNTVSNWEKGVSRPTAPVVDMIARVLVTSPFILVGNHTLRETRELALKTGKRTPDEEMYLTFALTTLKLAKMDINDIPNELLDTLWLTDIEAHNQGMSWEILLGGGGKELLLAFDHMSDKAKRLFLDYAIGLLSVPSYLLIPDDGVDEDLIDDLEKAKTELEGE